MIMADARTLLVVVDTNRPESVEDGSLLASCNRVAVIDHHRVGATYIQNAALGFIEPYASSTCELVTEILQELMEPTEMTKLEAEALLAGIVLDTKSFSIRTGERTFDAAAWLRRAGAETAEVKKLFQIDMDTTVARYKLMQNARLYQGIAVVVTDEMQSRIVSAQAADELLNISGVEASVVASPDGEGGRKPQRSGGPPRRYDAEAGGGEDPDRDQRILCVARFKVQSSEFKVQSSEFRVQSSEFKVQNRSEQDESRI